MPRLVILLLSVAALAILALQNLATTVPLVVLGKTLLDIQLGLLLALSVGVGALLTLFLYGLVGLRRAATSKYQPIGRRVPYPNSSGSTLPPSNGPSGPDSATSYSTKSPVDSGYSSSSAFVSEPKTDSVSGSESTGSSQPASQPFITPPQETPVKDTPPSASSADSYRSDSYGSDNYRSDSYYGSVSYDSGDYSSDSYSSADEETRADRNVTRADTESAGREEQSSTSAFLQQPISGLKSVFGKKKDPEVTLPNQQVGDDWGELRTPKQRNTWADGNERDYSLEAGARGLYEFGRNVGENAGRLAEDIASGWSHRTEEGRQTPYPTNEDNAYGSSQHDELDQGWENFDDYSEPPIQGAEKRTYGDSLYGGDEDRLDDGYADEPTRDAGPDDVYDADYRVIEPPSKPLS